MMRLIIKFFLIFSSASILSGCLFGPDGYIHNRKDNYLHAKTIAHTELPPTVSRVALETTYPVPDGPLPSSATPISIVPPGMPLATDKATSQTIAMSSQMLTNREVPTLKINTIYSKAWEAVNQQLSPLGYQVLGTDKATGIIEVKATNNTSPNNIYQFSLEKYKSITLVTVLDQQGQPANTTVSTSMLEQLAAQLNK